MSSKLLRLVSLATDSPAECLDRVFEFAEAHVDSIFRKKPSYAAVSLGEAMAVCSNYQNPKFASFLDEPTAARIQDWVMHRQLELPEHAPFGRFHDGDAALAQLCYAAARSTGARAIVETGVCYGVSSAYLLAALEMNGEGHLHSIDLPPLGENADNFVGWLVPKSLKQRWTLHRGTSSRLLPPLLENLGAIDLFLHDSLHTHHNMRDEFDAGWNALRPGGILIADDIEGNTAFAELVRSRKPSLSLAIAQNGKQALAGLAVKQK